MKSSCHRLIPFLPFLLTHLRLSSLELDPILFLLDYFTSRPLLSAPSRLLTLPFYNSSVRTPRKTPSSSLNDAVFTGPLPSNGCPPIVAWACVYDPLRSNGYTCHNIESLYAVRVSRKLMTSPCCLRVVPNSLILYAVRVSRKLMRSPCCLRVSVCRIKEKQAIISSQNFLFLIL
jgi:hypothetical protein